MNQIKLKLSKDLSKLLGIEINPENFSYPPNSEMGDLALPCFDIAKTKKINPAEAATQLADELKGKFDYLEDVKTAGPYLNFKFAIIELFALLNVKCKRSKVAKIMIEYSQPNTHKEFHVGHLRNACLGASLVEANRYVGNKVIAANYLGDTGVHVAKTLWNYQKFHKDDELPENKGQYLGKIYSEAVNKLEEDTVYQAEVSDLQKKLEQGDKEITKLWKETKQWSLDSFNDIYNLLNIKFDEYFWESEEEKSGRKLIDKILKDKKIKEIKESQGAIIADLKEHGLDVLVLIKSDGNVLYGTKDLPLGKKKFDKFKIDKSVYIVDNRQSLYLKQVFKLLDLLGYENKEKYHVAYDFVTLPEGAMASRTGNVVTFEDFYTEVLNLSQKETQKRHTDWNVKQVNDVAEKISLAAIKFWMLKYDNNKVIVFDPKKALAFDGDTGPYLLYTVARINSIFEKAKKQESKKAKKQNYELLKEKSERDLVLQIGKFDEVVEKVVKEYAPISLCTYLIELAQKINNFYHKCPVLDAENDLKEVRLALLDKAKETLEKGLKLLNIESVTKM
ncbi:arginine--tRNA ligase [Candidatus Falkowbacteria bacterium]|nr:arginine--tRNA ligase [Candidatus Falkowbacteria bacterium]